MRVWVLPILMVIAGCEAPRQSEWLAVTKSHSAVGDSRLPELLTDAELKGFLPPRVGDRVGLSPKGEMTRVGNRALSEATRSYAEDRDGPPAVHLKLADARLEPAATQAVKNFAGDDAEPAERLVLPGAIGYARYDEEVKVAQAQVLIAGRFIASATVEQAEGAQEAAEALRAIDTLAIAQRAQTSRK